MKKIELVLNPFDLKLVLDFNVNICSISLFYLYIYFHAFTSLKIMWEHGVCWRGVGGMGATVIDD